MGGTTGGLGRAGRAARALALALAAVLLALLVTEGLVALATGRALLTLPGADGHVARPLRRGPSGRASGGAAPDVGLYQVHPDPLVGYVLSAEADLRILDGTIRSDALGLRARPGPPPPPNALRLVVLGDSVAFGFGLDDDRTLAARLEQLLRDARGPAARPVACFTVAMPGWNHRNAVHFLLDHLDRLDPDLVVYMPVGNDLEDADGVLETGQRRHLVPDPAQPDPWLWVGPGVDPLRHVPAELAGDVGAHLDALASRIGPPALRSDVSPESVRRFDENARSIARLAEAMERRGGRVLVAHFTEGRYVWHLWRRLVESGTDLPVLPLYEQLPDALRLPGDPHPGEQATLAMAVWIAHELLGRGWIPDGGPGALAALPEAPAACAPFRAQRRDDAEVVRLSDQQRLAARLALRPALDTATLEGLQQLYTPLGPDGATGPRLLVALARAGDRLEVALAPLPDRPDLYPLAVAVVVDGAPVGTLTVGPEGIARETWTLAPPAAPGAVLEVRLAPERWVVGTAGQPDALVSVRPVRIASVP
jgi:hypothetical protein